MSLFAALACVSLAALVGNRVVSILVGLALRVPSHWLFATVMMIDLAQIPFYYKLYESGEALTDRLPAPFNVWIRDLRSMRPQDSWALSMGGVGVFLVALLPTFGGGIWSSVFVAHALKIRKSWSLLIIAAASLLSFLVLYGMLSTLFMAARYFW